MRFFFALCAASAFGATLFGSAAALADAPTDYNLFVLHDMAVSSGDTEGRVAVGGNATLTSYSIGNSVSSATTNFVVGGNLNAGSGTAKGSTIVAGTVTGSVGPANPFTTNLLPSGTAVPVDFTAAASYLTQRSLELSAFAGAGTASLSYSTLTLTGAASGPSVFNLTAAQLASTSTLVINLTPGTTALINVSGASSVFQYAGTSIIGGTASDVLWNFYDATSLTIQGINMIGSVLAPKASFSSSGGQLHGTLIVDSFHGGQWGGSMELHNDGRYTGGLLTPTTPVPEPASWAMMIAGFGLIGGALRRRRGFALA